MSKYGILYALRALILSARDYKPLLNTNHTQEQDLQKWKQKLEKMKRACLTVTGNE